MTSAPVSSIAPFQTSAELVGHAESMLRARCDSLRKDVGHCLAKPYAPFPAILYCFSTVDLFGALAAGQGGYLRRATRHSKDYMRNFLHYLDPIPTLLMGIFRHKLVHLATPKAVFEYKDNASVRHNVVWVYTHDNARNHLKLQNIKGEAKIDDGLWIIPYDQSFWLDIPSFTKDIINSAMEPNGYLAQLRTDSTIQLRYAAAVKDLYDPRK